MSIASFGLQLRASVGSGPGPGQASRARRESRCLRPARLVGIGGESAFTAKPQRTRSCAKCSLSCAAVAFRGRFAPWIRSLRATSRSLRLRGETESPRKCASSKRALIAAHQADEAALDLDAVGAEDAGFVGGVCGLERDLRAAFA